MNTKGNVIVLIILISAFILIVLSFVRFKFLKPKDINLTTYDSITPSLNITDTPTPESEVVVFTKIPDTTKWKVYKDEVLNFSFKYPPDFNVIKGQETPHDTISNGSVTIIPNNYWNIGVTPAGPPACQTDKDALDLYKKGYLEPPSPLTNIVKSVVANKEFLGAEAVISQADTNKRDINMPMCLNKHYFAIGIIFSEGFDKESLLQGILSTFKTI